MIDLTGCVSIPYFKKTVFTGSDGKMRYLLGKAEENEETVLKAWYWEMTLCQHVCAGGEKNGRSFSIFRRRNQPSGCLAE